MIDCPQHYNFIFLVERVFGVYEQKYPILCHQLFVPNSLNPVYCIVNSLFNSVGWMVILTRHSGFSSCDPYNNLSKKWSPCFPNSDWANSRLFVKRNETACYKPRDNNRSNSRIANRSLLSLTKRL